MGIPTPFKRVEMGIPTSSENVEVSTPTIEYNIMKYIITIIIVYNIKNRTVQYTITIHYNAILSLRIHLVP